MKTKKQRNQTHSKWNEQVLKEVAAALLLGSTFVFFSCSRNYGITEVEPPPSIPNNSQQQEPTGPGGSGPGGGGSPTDFEFYSVEKEITVANSQSKKVDILFIVDNSISMAPIQNNMASRFKSFIDSLGNLDFQIAISTTDVSADKPLADGRFISFDGGLLDPSFVLSSQSQSLAEIDRLFGNTIRRPETGNGFEQGILSFQRTLDRFQDPSVEGEKYRNFFRQDSGLAVVIISNSNEEFDPVRDPATGDVYRPSEYNVNIKANHKESISERIQKMFPQKAFSWNSIIVIPGDKKCLEQRDSNGKVYNEYYGTNYNNLSNRTGGLVGTVCADDYSSQLSELGTQVTQMVNTISLDCDVEDSDGDGKKDIKVIVDGTPLSSDRFEIKGNQVKARGNFPNGRYKLEYVCKRTKRKD